MVANDQLEDLLGKVFDGAREGLRGHIPPDDYAQRRRDFIFHMTDWKEEIQQLANLFNTPGEKDQNGASDFLIGFLYHVIPHLNAAGRLLLDDVLDPFSHPDSDKTAPQHPQAKDVATATT
jgi:hypothetical protein